jgi:beta-galactosidase
LLPHWSWPGREGQEIDVWAQSNCEEVELFLNGQSQGRKKMEKNSHLEWKVKYAPGTLLARGYTGGKEILTTKVETTGEPTVIQLTPHQAELKADGEDVSVVTVQVNDPQGRMVPVANNTITFEIAGPGKIIGVGNGDPSSHEPDQYVAPAPWKRSLFNGLAQVIVQSTSQPVEITLTAKSQGVADGVMKLQTQPAVARAALP